MLLINPATHPFGGFLSRYVPVGIPVSIGMISAYLEANGIPCRVHDEEIEKLQKKVADKYGYTLVDHKLELYGIKKKS